MRTGKRVVVVAALALGCLSPHCGSRPLPCRRCRWPRARAGAGVRSGPPGRAARQAPAACSVRRARKGLAVHRARVARQARAGGLGSGGSASGTGGVPGQGRRARPRRHGRSRRRFRYGRCAGHRRRGRRCRSQHRMGIPWRSHDVGGLHGRSRFDGGDSRRGPRYRLGPGRRWHLRIDANGNALGADTGRSTGVQLHGHRHRRRRSHVPGGRGQRARRSCRWRDAADVARGASQPTRPAAWGLSSWSSVALDSQARIVVVGTRANNNATVMFRRYLPSGAIDLDVGSDGSVTNLGPVAGAGRQRQWLCRRQPIDLRFSRTP